MNVQIIGAQILSSLFSLCPHNRFSLKRRKQGWSTIKGKQLPHGMIEVKMAAEARRNDWSPGEMGLGVGEKYPHSVGVREYVLDRNYSWKIMV